MVSRSFVFLALALFSLLFAASHAGAQQYRFRALTLEDGLPQSQVLAVHQDPQPYVLFKSVGESTVSRNISRNSAVCLNLRSRVTGKFGWMNLFI